MPNFSHPRFQPSKADYFAALAAEHAASDAYDARPSVARMQAWQDANAYTNRVIRALGLSSDIRYVNHPEMAVSQAVAMTRAGYPVVA